MNLKEEKLAKDQGAMAFFGTAYVKLPRSIVSRFLNNNPTEKNLGLVHLILFSNCNYAKTKIATEDNIECNYESEAVGEWNATYEHISQQSHLSVRTVRRCIKDLKTAGFVTTTHIGRKTNFYVCGYEQFTTGDNNNYLSVNDASGRKQQHQRPWTCQPDYSREQEATMRIVGEGVSHVELVDYSSCMKKEHYG